MILYRLYQTGEQTQTQLANSLSMAKPPLGKTLEKLEEESWITRRQNPQDRRENLVNLTGKVAPLVEPLTKIVAGIDEVGMSTLQPLDQVALKRLLLEVRKNLLHALEEDI